MKIKTFVWLTGVLVLLAACDFGALVGFEHPALLQAVIDKDYVTMEYLLQKSADPDEHTRKMPKGHSAYNDEHTPLTMAAATGDVHAVRLLLEYKADRHKATKNGQTPLEWALYRDHLDTAKMIWEHAPHSGYVSHGTFALVISLYKDDYETYRYFRSYLKSDRHIQNMFIRILGNASGVNIRGQVKAEKIIAYLIDQGEKPGAEALVASMHWYSPKILKTILQTGLNPDALIDKNIYDLDFKRIKGDNRKRFDKLNGNTALMTFLRAPSGIDITRSLLANGADINALNSKGQNALMYFVSTSYTSKRYMEKFSYKVVDGVPAPSSQYTGFFAPVIQFYLDNGALTTLIDKQGRNLLQQIHPDDFDAAHKRRLLTGH